jgi:hypothetical protein
MSRDNTVGIATSYGLDDGGFGFRVSVGPGIFSMSSSPALCRGQENMDLYIHSHISFHGVVLK